MRTTPALRPGRAGWSSGPAAGWVVVVLLGMMNLFESDLYPRWLILGGSWLAAVFLGGPLWRRLPIPAVGAAAGFAAIAVNLLAAGGIGIPAVALGFWSMLAIGLNLRDDRGCGRLREYASRVPPFVLSLIWAAMAGLLAGDVLPYWKAEAAIAEAEAAMRRQPPDFKAAEKPSNAPSRPTGPTFVPGWATPRWPTGRGTGAAAARTTGAGRRSRHFSRKL